MYCIIKGAWNLPIPTTVGIPVMQIVKAKFKKSNSDIGDDTGDKFKVQK